MTAREKSNEVIDEILLELSSMNEVAVTYLGTFVPKLREENERFIPSRSVREIIPAHINAQFRMNQKFKARLSKLKLKNVKMD